jgi:hypothetical protein
MALSKPAAKETAKATGAKPAAPKSTSAAKPKAKKPTQLVEKVQKEPVFDLPNGISEDIPPDRLLLDPQNLRLLERTGGAYENLEVKLFGQNAIQRKLFEIIDTDKRFDIQKLADSIAYSGFLKHERLIVAKYDGDKFLVLEGNRRVTAIRRLIEKFGPEFEGLAPNVRDSLRTLPCFVLNGDVIDGSSEKLNEYRRGAEIYIGMRHLMGAKNWEPASRYEFQARLISEENWSVNDVAVRFGRDKSDVIRDFQAHLLYQEFVKYERTIGVHHSLTYNSFAEAARAPVIKKWLGWKEKEQEFSSKQNERIFFRYLVSRLSKSATLADSENYNPAELPEISAEAAVRKLRDMLKLDDMAVQEALNDFDFNTAEILFEERKEGEFSKKIQGFIRVLKRTPNDELVGSADVVERLRELQVQIDKALKVIAVLSGA